jgi:hypothetical protein
MEQVGQSWEKKPQMSGCNDAVKNPAGNLLRGQCQVRFKDLNSTIFQIL